MDARLKPCPFCGGEAEVRKLDLDAIEEGWQLYGVWCTDDLHAEEHGGYQHGHYIDNYATEEKAIAAWNARADMERGAVPMTEENMAEHGWVRERTCHDTWDTELTGRLRFQCSECGSVSLDFTPRYCPSCGARVIVEWQVD